MRRAAGGLLLLATSALAACAADDAGAGDAAFVVSDSAGVQLVRNAAGADSLLPLAEELRIGALDGPEHLQFFRIFDIAVDDGGRMYVANDRDGAFAVRGPRRLAAGPHGR